MILIQFQKGVTDGLLLVGKAPIQAPGWPMKRSLLPTPIVGKKPMVAKPIAIVRYNGILAIVDVRYDGTHHWPDVEEKGNRCLRLQCSMLMSDKCGKCQMHLCFQKDKNCFKIFHN